MRRRLGLTGAVLIAALAAGAARAELFSKAYTFKPNTVLQVGADIGDGLKVDTIEFVVVADDGSPSGLFNTSKVKVTISNLGEASVRVGIAVAVADADNRLVAVASGGTKLFALRGGRQMVYTLDIDGVSAEISKGTAFRISIEPTH